ncbi:B3/B4 domain-containing protein [Jeotgalibacillus campisalis]|uniref:Phenylalanine-tRNA ligase n=1 Tax=Jeotgalibacillus campisalis TaxID=220754 RepID=A0A0C2VCX6_9BACL|nr:phenylalanine--tRNA ligase beta subunit-related protein [Jeotgalibacillus campisalis]KIL46807.1 phenylalanine-tRNA ligase [Jeotgalibacillus campisalis]
MKVYVHPTLQHKEPLSFGIIQYKDIQIGESPQMLKGRLQLFQESIFFELQDSQVTDLEGIKEWRRIFKALGKDPNRYRPSAESLYRRIKKQNYLTPVHSAVDLNNFFSLEYQSPIGLYDTSQINGDVSIRLGEPGEEYTGLNGRSNSLKNLLVSADENGAFGSPFVDSQRTAVNQSTNEALQIIYLRPSLSPEDHLKLTESLKDMFLQVHGGSGKSYII